VLFNPGISILIAMLCKFVTFMKNGVALNTTKLCVSDGNDNVVKK